MAIIEPFRGVRYSEKVSQRMNELITLPYDKISPEKREEYIKRNPYNFVNLILNDHSDANRLLNRWLKDGIFIRDKEPLFYFYLQEFLHPITQDLLKREGIIALIKLEDFGKNIFPHEKTLKKPKEDRLNLLRKTQANLGQIFMLYKDQKDSVNSLLRKYIKDKVPIYNFEGLPGRHHTIWKIEDKELIDNVKKIFYEKKLFIADGHHRYEVSNIYRKEMKDKLDLFSFPENPEFVMGTLVNVYSKSIVILPTHRYIEIKDDPERLLKDWKNYFIIEEIKGKEKLKRALEENKVRHSIGIYIGEKYLLLTPIMEKVREFFDPENSERWNMLDVNILHRTIIDRIKERDIEFYRDWDKCIDRAKKGQKGICFFLNPTDKFDVLSIAERLEKMPQKSTDFYPKLPSGLVLNKMILKDEKP